MDAESKIIKGVMLVLLVPIFAFAFIYVYIQENNPEHVKSEYEKIRNLEFSGCIIEKKKDGDYPRAGRNVYLKNYRQISVSDVLYQKIMVGDSVSKPKNSDSIFFYLKNGAIEIADYNTFAREKYVALLKKNRE